MTWVIDKKADEAVYDDKRNLTIVINNMAAKGDDGPMYDVTQFVLFNDIDTDSLGIVWDNEPTTLEEAVAETKKALKKIISTLQKATK